MQNVDLKATPREARPPVGRAHLATGLTSENLPSPNHCTHRMPGIAWRLEVAFQDTTMAGHQENPLIFPHTRSPIPNSLSSWKKNQQEEL